MTQEEYAEEDSAQGAERSLSRRAMPLLLMLAAAALIGLFYLGWQHYGPSALNKSRFRLTGQQIEVTLTPDWIEGEIVTEVVREGALDEISLRDPEATVKIARAFKLHPWVKDVKRVSKHSDGTVRVNIKYRRPAGWVRVEGGHFAVDRQGILLPTNVARAVADRFPFIDIGETYPDFARRVLELEGVPA